jgi:hypothetical protein
MVYFYIVSMWFTVQEEYISCSCYKNFASIFKLPNPHKNLCSNHYSLSINLLLQSENKLKFSPQCHQFSVLPIYYLLFWNIIEPIKHLSVRWLSRKCGSLNVSQLYEPSWSVTGTALPFLSWQMKLNHIKPLSQNCIIMKSHDSTQANSPLLHCCYIQMSFLVFLRSCWSDYIYAICMQISCTLLK